MHVGTWPQGAGLVLYVTVIVFCAILAANNREMEVVSSGATYNRLQPDSRGVLRPKTTWLRAATTVYALGNVL